MDSHFRYLGKNDGQASALRSALFHRGVKDLMCDVSSQLRSEHHHDALRKDGSICMFDVKHHLLRVNQKPFRSFSHRANCHTGRLDHGSNYRPLGLPASDAALVLLQHCRKEATRPGTRCAAASVSTQAVGLRLFGMVEEPPRPSPPVSAASPTSFCISKLISRATFPRDPVNTPQAQINVAS